MFPNQKIVFFDGVCNLCSSVVQLLIRHNAKENLLFASLQSKTGQEMLAHFQLSATEFNSFVYLKEGKLLQKSEAALELSKELKHLWPMFYVFMIVPKFIRNAVYDLIAKNRYNWFGKKNECWLPSIHLKKRFLD